MVQYRYIQTKTKIKGTMGGDFNKQLRGAFAPISLTELNASASFLDRRETKFLLTEQQFIDIIHEFTRDFYVLEISGKAVFEYDNVYMDDEKYSFYKEHQKWEKSRTKVRTREYVDSGAAYFEYKQKQGKLLRKFRYPISLREHGKMTTEADKFYAGISMSFNGREKIKELSRSLRTEYNRLTLCSKDSSERVTVDFDIELSSLRWEKKSTKLSNAVILESKTTKKWCISHEIMKKYNIKQAKSCSKYCLWLIMNNVFEKQGRFKDTIKKIESMS